MIKIAIVDDDKNFCNELEKIIVKNKSNFNEAIETDVFFSGKSLIDYLDFGNKIDLIFLDIEMNNINGVETGKILRNNLEINNTQIIYISSKSSYAMDLFQTRPLDFIIKPITEEQILKSINLFEKLYVKSREFFDFTFENISYRIPIKDIIYFNSCGRKIILHTSKDSYSFYSKLSQIKKILSNKNFILTHKSYLVNYDHISKTFYEELFLTNGEYIPISQSHRKDVRDFIYKNINED